MKPKQKILEFIQKAYEESDGGRTTSRTGEMTDDDRLSIQELFDGMSTGTARIIIEEEMDSQMVKEYSIAPLENKGRYYVARIVQTDGKAIRRLLVDKQTGKVQFIGR
ncbi:MAG: hypothetical protein KKE62_12940 [Proteobacteria bacterium]|nr:hypothetical protein [Pseudomonadota bacterium]MBU1543736.1 hypothetical protein [Pseudomonadota bacterium]MBU2482987.1 hypothetical protein [Pseudomonadota bacterium]